MLVVAHPGEIFDLFEMFSESSQFSKVILKLISSHKRQDLESVDQEGWQSFDLTSYADQTVSSIHVVIKGTGSGTPGFTLLDAKFLGEEVIVPTDTFYVRFGRVDGPGVPLYILGEGESAEKRRCRRSCWC